MAARKPGKGKDKRGRVRKSTRKSPMTAGEKKLAQEREEGATISFNPDDVETVDDILEAVPQTKMGRPTSYDPKFVPIARKMCSMGATDSELADAFNVSIDSIRRWQVTHTDFCDAVKVGAGEYDHRIERSLAQRALGYSYKATKIMQYEGSPMKVDYIEHVPPDVGAIKHWLMNRKRDAWTGDRSDVNFSGTVKTEGKEADMVELARHIAFIFAQAENAKKA